MARALTFAFKNSQIACAIEKVDRSKLYGFVDVEALDGKNRPCQLATLADDGRTVIGMGGTAFGYLSPDGEWQDKNTLKPTGSDGKEIQPVPSSFSAPVALSQTASIEEYLSHNIKGIYQLRPDGDFSAVAAELKQGAIFTFPYSFRGGLEADVGFLLAAPDGNCFLAVGQPTSIHFVGLEEASAPLDDDSADDAEDDALDFSMM